MAFKHYLNEPHLGEKEKQYLHEVIDKGWLSAGGEYTKNFENKFADYIGVKHCVAVQSGTAALHTAMLALGISQGDKVVVPNYTCSGCATSVIQSGAEPLIIDIDKETFCLDAEKFKEAIDEYGGRIKAVMPIHIYGFIPRDFKKIINIAKENNIKIIEDTSEAHGAEFEGKKAGSFGDISTFSIRSEKMLGVGEGGIVLTNDSDLHKRANFFASRGCDFDGSKQGWWERYYYRAVGMNYRLPHLLGAVALAQMEKFENTMLRMKRIVGNEYNKLLANDKELVLQKRIDNSNPAYWLNAVVLKNKTKEQVRQIGIEMLKAGFEIRPGFWPLADMEYLKKYGFGSQKNGNYVFEHAIVLPSSIKLADNLEGIKEIIQKLKELI